MLPPDSTLLCWRGQTVGLTPPHPYFVYLLHFHRRYYPAGHYTGMTACLALHRRGRGARLMKAIVSAGITFEVARLWKVDTYEEARALERALKRRHDGTTLCPGLPAQTARRPHTVETRP